MAPTCTCHVHYALCIAVHLKEDEDIRGEHRLLQVREVLEVVTGRKWEVKGSLRSSLREDGIQAVSSAHACA